MFTGLVEGRCRVDAANRSGGALTLWIDLRDLSEGVNLGDSIAIEGCCLTVEKIEGSRARFAVGEETLSLTHLGDLADGSEVNVERSLRLGDRFGGHMVSGHVDDTGKILSLEDLDGQTTFTFEVPDRLVPQLLLKGSVAVDGTSLTIASLEGRRFTVAVIPHTLEMTTLGVKSVGDPVNIETDMVGKWICQMAEPYLPPDNSEGEA